MAHSNLDSRHPTILIIHGLGDSSLSYHEFISAQLLKNYNVLIPDLLGHGKSSSVIDYSFKQQMTGIIKHIQHLKQQDGIDISDIIILSHSMGGIIATLLCESELKNKIKGFINIEGSITQYGSFISHQVAETLKNKHFTNWFDEFRQNKVYSLGDDYMSYRRYYASLMFCHPQAFLQNATEMYQMSIALPGKYTHLMGKKYIELRIPKIYCYGDSMCQETLDFLQENNLAMRHFNFPNHFFMPDAFEEFVKYIKRFMRSIKENNNG